MKLSYFLSLALASSVFIIGCGTGDGNTSAILEDKTQTITINSVPVASNAKLSISSDNTEASLTLTAVDMDNDTLTFEQISSPKHGKITNFDKTNGTFTYIAEDGFLGEDKFTYSVSDGVSKCPPKTVTIDVTPQEISLPLAPDSIVVTRGCSCSVKLSWKDNSDNEDGFEIYKDGKLVCVKDADETSVEIGGLSASTTYRFEVRAKNASGKSKAIKAEFTTAPALEKPKAPTDLKVKAKDDKTVRLNWSENSDNESTYEIYQNGTYLKTISANCACTIIGDLSPNTSYTFEVKAKNDAGVSDGAIVTFTTNPPKDKPPVDKPKTNKAPTIKTISNKVIKEGESVAISATASDSDGRVVKYVWSEGSKTLSSKASFDYTPTKVGEHFLIITVTDDKNATSKSTIKVVVKPKPKPVKPNEAPTANAGEDKTTQEQKSITLVATATDSDGSIASYKWEENGIILGTKSTLIFTPKTVGKHTLTFTATDNKGLSSSDNVTVTATPAPDTTKPVITLKGKATINLTVGDSYKDAGVSAKDNKDGDITSQIVKSGKVDPTKVGTYIIKYSVVDKAGNKADEVTRTVIVKEKPNQAPVIKSFTIDKSSLTLYDTVYARFTVSDLDGKSSVIKVVDDIEGQIFIHAYKGAIGKNGGGGQPFKPKKVGKHTLTLIADDGLGKVTTKKLTFVVKESPSTPPKVEWDSLVIKQDETKAIRLRGSDVDGDKLTYRITKNPKYGKVSLLGDKATYTPKKGYTGSDSFEFKANDGKVDSLAGEIRVTIVKKEEPKDTIKPLIKLKGKASVSISAEDRYTDKGATASDDKDGDITSKIVKTGTVDTTKVGTYTLKYNVSDIAGNKATEVIRTVVVKEKKVENKDPVIENFTISTTELYLGEKLGFSGSVTDLDGTHYNIQISDSLDGNFGGSEGNGVMGEKHPISGLTTPRKVGTHIFSITATDGLGGTATKELTYVVKEKQAPVASNVYITGIGKVGETLTGHYTYSDAENDPEYNSSYYWEREDGKVLASHTKSYTIKDLDAGKSITFNVQAHSKEEPRYREEVISDPIQVEYQYVPNKKPTARNDIHAMLNENTHVDIHLGGTDPEDAQLTYKIVEYPKHGSVNRAKLKQGILYYAVNKDYVGYDSFKYVVNDGELDSDPAIVDINIYQNSPPEAIIDRKTFENKLPYGSTFTFSGARSHDPDADVLTYKWESDKDGLLSEDMEFSINTLSINQHTITLTVTDTSGETGTFHKNIEVLDNGGNTIPDTTKPIITLKGSSPKTIKVGEAYTDEGASATDDIDSSVNVDIDTSTLDTNTAGTYYVIFTARDSAGNVAEKRRKVIVEEDNSGGNTSIPKEIIIEGDLERYKGSNVSDSILLQNVTATATDGTDMTSKVKIINKGGLDANTLGEYIVTYSVKDDNGNNEVTASRKVIINAGKQ